MNTNRIMQFWGSAFALCVFGVVSRTAGTSGPKEAPPVRPVIVHQDLKHDVSPALASIPDSRSKAEPAQCGKEPCGNSPADSDANDQQGGKADDSAPAPPPAIPPAAAAIEQTSPGKRPEVPMLDSFDGLGAGFEGPQGTATLRNPSDNSLAVGPDHIVQVVNTRLAVYTKKGSRFEKTGKVLYGPVATNSIFAGFGGPCEERNNGDAVARYDQLAGRWLIVMPLFAPISPEELAKEAEPAAGEPVSAGQLAKSGQQASRVAGHRRCAAGEPA